MSLVIWEIKFFLSKGLALSCIFSQTERYLIAIFNFIYILIKKLKINILLKFFKSPRNMFTHLFIKSFIAIADSENKIKNTIINT
jgi:hypothetical protein